MSFWLVVSSDMPLCVVISDYEEDSCLSAKRMYTLPWKRPTSQTSQWGARLTTGPYSSSSIIVVFPAKAVLGFLLSRPGGPKVSHKRICYKNKQLEINWGKYVCWNELVIVLDFFLFNFSNLHLIAFSQPPIRRFVTVIRFSDISCQVTSQTTTSLWTNPMQHSVHNKAGNIPGECSPYVAIAETVDI